MKKGPEFCGNLVATVIVPIIKLFEVIKSFIVGNSEAKTLFSDVIKLMDQVQYNLSLKRTIKPQRKKEISKYHNLCHISILSSCLVTM